MKITDFRSGFLTASCILAILAYLISPSLLAFSALLVCIVPALLIASLDWREDRTPGAAVVGLLPHQPQWSGYALGGLTLATAGVAGIIIGVRCGIEDLPQLALLALMLAGLVAALLTWVWNQRQPVLFNEQINLSTLFGFRRIRGPTRYQPLPLWFGRPVSVIGLRPLKVDLVVEEIDTREPNDQDASHLRIINATRPRPEEKRSNSPRIHSIALSVNYQIDGERWFFLNSIPNASSRKQAISANFAGSPKPAHLQAAFWDQLVADYVHEEVPEVLRRVVHREGWSAIVASNERTMVADVLLDQLRQEVAPYGIVIVGVDINSVAVESPEAERAARNLALQIEHQAEGEFAILRQAQQLLADPNMAPGFAAFVQSVVLELGYQKRPNLILRTDRPEYALRGPQSSFDRDQRDAA
ncbi:MAG: hypothetical protein HGA65_08855 [Oscillochloris sp.]|nr:hypothetical protein [Oscillochloris sp.]